MKERPIIFNAEMVRAILEDRKSQTRRVVKPQPGPIPDEIKRVSNDNGYWWSCSVVRQMIQLREMSCFCPYGTVGDRLWVRETWGLSGHNRVEYRAFPADGKDFRCVSLWKPSIHMPRWASRITLEIKSVRVERVQDITEGDAKAEGCSEWIPCSVYTGLKGVRIGGAARKGTHKEYFELLWNSINSKRGYGWSSNPWVWVIEFEKLEENENE